MSDQGAMKPLDGLLVVSIEQAVAAPYCSSRLADAGARRRVFFTLLLSFGYAGLLSILGFTITSVLALAAFFIVFGERRWRIVVPMAVLVPVLTKQVFLHFFMLELPAGLFENLPI